MIKKEDSLIQCDETISKLKNYFREKAFLLVYLFGSQATGNTGSLSDFDIAILTSEAPKSELNYTFAHDLFDIFGTNRIDVVSLNNAPIEL